MIALVTVMRGDERHYGSWSEGEFLAILFQLSGVPAPSQPACHSTSLTH